MLTAHIFFHFLNNWQEIWAKLPLVPDRGNTDMREANVWVMDILFLLLQIAPCRLSLCAQSGAPRHPAGVAAPQEMRAARSSAAAPAAPKSSSWPRRPAVGSGSLRCLSRAGLLAHQLIGQVIDCPDYVRFLFYVESVPAFVCPTEAAQGEGWGWRGGKRRTAFVSLSETLCCKR